VFKILPLAAESQAWLISLSGGLYENALFPALAQISTPAGWKKLGRNWSKNAES
jgi:hypothetical protein